MKKYLHSRRVILIAAILIVAASAIALPRAFVVQALGKLGIPIVTSVPKSVPVQPNAVTAAPAPALQQPSEQIPVIVIYSTTGGFEPSEITVRPKSYFLMIRNRSGLDDLSFSVIDVKEKDKDKAEKFKTRAALGSNSMVKLALGAGEFKVVEASNPNWVCKINVMP